MRPIASSGPNTFAAPVTKIASIVLPIIMVTVPFAPALRQHGVLNLIITCAPSKSASLTSIANTIPAHQADAITNSDMLLGRG